MRTRSSASLTEVLQSFHTNEPFKALAVRFGMSPNTLRTRWVEEFGIDAFKARGKANQAVAAAAFNQERDYSKIDRKFDSVPCVKCGVSSQVSRMGTWRLDRSNFVCASCSGDRDCPVCGQRVDGEKGLAAHLGHQKDEPHTTYLQGIEESVWEGKTEPEDYVTCRECGYRGASLAMHVPKHGLTVHAYRVKFPSALIQSEASSRRRSVGAANRSGGFGKGDMKTVSCPGCGEPWVGSKFLVPGTHDLRCSSCKEKDRAVEEARYETLSEPEDYVTCLDCGHRAESLVSHMQSQHRDYMTRHPKAVVVALNSAIRDKAALRGRVLSEDTKRLMSANAGRWNKGLTKNTDARMASISRAALGRVSWNKGLTKATASGLVSSGEKTRIRCALRRTTSWVNPRFVLLPRAELERFVEEDQTVDHHRMVSDLGLSLPIVLRNIRAHGLAPTSKYLIERALNQEIRIEKEILESFKDRRGGVQITKACYAIGHSHKAIRRECFRQGLTISRRLIKQTLCLNALATILSTTYNEEWETMAYTNPLTGRRFRFDGFFPEYDLVVEFHGYQHYTYPNAFMKTEAEFEAQKERDCIKKEMVESTSGKIYMEILEDEPFMDEMYLRGRLVQAGVTPAR